METPVEVVHTVLGRVRVRLPTLKRPPEYEALQQRVRSLAAVKAVRVNPTARSLIVHYDPQSTPEETFNTKLIFTLQSIGLADPQAETAIDLTARPQGQLSFDCEPIQLTTYEQSQFEAIEAWKHRRIEGLEAILGWLLISSRGLLNFLFLNSVLEKVAGGCERVTGNWQHDWEKLKPSVGVQQPIELRRGALERSDQLSAQVTKAAEKQAVLQGSLSGLFDVFGEIADEGLTLVLAVQTIHRVGLCYGYAPQTPDERAFAWAIFNAAIAPTQEEFETTQATLRQLQRSLNKQALEDTALEDTLEEDVEDLLIDTAIEQGVALLTGETFAGIVPVLSVVMSLLADRNLITNISIAATREFQQRWLLENRKIRFPNPSTP